MRLAGRVPSVVGVGDIRIVKSRKRPARRSPRARDDVGGAALAALEERRAVPPRGVLSAARGELPAFGQTELPQRLDPLLVASPLIDRDRQGDEGAEGDEEKSRHVPPRLS